MPVGRSATAEERNFLAFNHAQTNRTCKPEDQQLTKDDNYQYDRKTSIESSALIRNQPYHCVLSGIVSIAPS